MHNGIVILDFGSQYNQLIARRIRELGVYAEILPHTVSLDTLKAHQPAGIILSGGPASVYAEGAPQPPEGLLEQGWPILGICYGMQVLSQLCGGQVEPAAQREFGQAELSHTQASALFAEVPERSQVWMSHGDHVTRLPEGFTVLAHSDNAIAAIADTARGLYALQFHPEVTHSVYGTQMLANFALQICRAPQQWSMQSYIDTTIASIREQVGSERVVLGLSGGVDSSVAAVLIQRAIGSQLTCIFVDTGLLRKNEAADVMRTYGEHFEIDLHCIDARERFFKALEGVSDPEQKRKIIGREFVAVFQAEAARIENVGYLAQGTIYPDVIESQSVKGPSATIKSHHNVGGLPEELHLKLLEPLRELFKDEVRQVGRELGIPAYFIDRHPFPGPGLGIRVLGEISAEKVAILQEADAIFLDELRRSGWYDKVSQAFVALLPVKSVGVMGDERTYEYTAVVRSVDTQDFMTATWSQLPYDLLERVSRRIINEVRGINRVTYDISSKPPATVEWE
ncbi:MAG: glutamine-hydrolyzing GMP synthase [Candidatus Sericytochromatia bacterium]|nr:glutamine-hydrolyzing GMP synthase [Candidatus Sericytochromatia bacterium]